MVLQRTGVFWARAAIPNFYMREFLHSEIAQIYGTVNVPADADLANENRMNCAQ